MTSSELGAFVRVRGAQLVAGGAEGARERELCELCGVRGAPSAATLLCAAPRRCIAACRTAAGCCYLPSKAAAQARQGAPGCCGELPRQTCL